MELKNQRDHMRAMGQFVPDSEDEDEEEGQVRCVVVVVYHVPIVSKEMVMVI